jgi:hypothetical protein
MQEEEISSEDSSSSTPLDENSDDTKEFGRLTNCTKEGD